MATRRRGVGRKCRECAWFFDFGPGAGICAGDYDVRGRRGSSAACVRFIDEERPETDDGAADAGTNPTPDDVSR